MCQSKGLFPQQLAKFPELVFGNSEGNFNKFYDLSSGKMVTREEMYSVITQEG